jgi:hypothetical protein
MTPIEDVFNLMYGLITDTDLAKLSDEDLKDLSLTFLKHTIVKFKECKVDLTLVDDENGETYFKDELDLEEQSILAYGMLYYYLHHKVMYNKMMKNAINTKDFNQLSNANLLLRLNELLNDTRKEFNRRRKAYSKRYDDFEGFN